MSCRDKQRCSFLIVKSEIVGRDCTFSPGASAVHQVTMTSYAVLDIEVNFHCACPDGAALSYPGGYVWEPEPVMLLAAGVGRPDRSVSFDDVLAADSAPCPDPRPAQLKLEPRRRRLPTGPLEHLPVMTIDLTVA